MNGISKNNLMLEIVKATPWIKLKQRRNNMNGSIKWFSDQKGYGFITPEDGSKDIFCHFSAIKSDNKRKSLDEGDKVSFEVVDGEKGKQATNVRKI